MKEKIGELSLGFALFVIGTIGLITRHLSQEKIPFISPLALIFMGADVSMKKMKQKYEVIICSEWKQE